MEPGSNTGRRRFLLAAAGCCLPLAGAKKPDDKPVDLALTNLNGGRVRLRDYRGKVVVLNFWATWCGPCREELPMLAATEKKHRAAGVVFIAASLDENKTKPRIPEFLSKYGIEFAVWSGATGDDLFKLGMGEAVPATAFLDEQGRIVARVSGTMRKAEMEERLAWLASDRTGPAPKPFVDHVR